MLDYALTDPGVDPAKVALPGVSLGGMLAPRAAAVVAVDGVFDAAAAVIPFPPGDRAEIERRANAPRDEELDGILAAGRAANPTLRWATGHGRYVMGAATDREFLAKYLTYQLDGGVAELISRPALICEATDELFFNGHADTHRSRAASTTGSPGRRRCSASPPRKPPTPTATWTRSAWRSPASTARRHPLTRGRNRCGRALLRARPHRRRPRCSDRAARGVGNRSGVGPAGGHSSVASPDCAVGPGSVKACGFRVHPEFCAGVAPGVGSADQAVVGERVDGDAGGGE
ncbi:hypothetical protein [Amycolatopsis sp. FDAARGOS 1241]|uniref:hypothetical protein n=1 Tax=Amycolatopsis sp. FDAARGOS 1241 TaxID=2778070 RepID=UPI001EF3CCE2|nr:hypothetical protein [Amycolatopsis sp. FDAARGOS 1241]